MTKNSSEVQIRSQRTGFLSSLIFLIFGFFYFFLSTLNIEEFNFFKYHRKIFISASGVGEWGSQNLPPRFIGAGARDALFSPFTSPIPR